MQYELSAAADRDLEAIFDYTEHEFGAGQAAAYLTRISEQLETLMDNPALGRDRDEVRPGLRSLAVGQHVLFYRLLSDRLRIVRVLHGRQDLLRLKDD